MRERSADRGTAGVAGWTRIRRVTGRRALSVCIIAAFVLGALAGAGPARAKGDPGTPLEYATAMAALGPVPAPLSGDDAAHDPPQAHARGAGRGANVLVVHTLCLGSIDATCGELDGLTSMLRAADSVASVATWNFMNYPGIPAAPDVAFMQRFDAIVVATNWGYLGDPAYESARRYVGDNLADYVDSGRGGVLTTMCVYCLDGTGDAFDIRGRYMSEAYGPYQQGSEAYSLTSGIVTLLPSDPLLDGVGTDVVSLGAHASSLRVTLGGGGWNTAGRNGVEVAQWAPDHTSAVGKKILNNGACTVHLGGLPLAGADAERLLGNAVRCADTVYAPLTVTIQEPASGSAFAVGTPVTFAGGFTDPATGSPHTAEWSFGAIRVPGTVADSGGSGTVTDTFTFAEGGVYPVSLTVTDVYGASRTASTVDGLEAYVAIFDPRDVASGGGWIASSMGADAYDRLAAGRATFDFAAKYHKDDRLPTATIGFRFEGGDFAFAGSAYGWLACGGAMCQLRGFGTVTIGHGPGSLEAEAGFLATVVDGRLRAGGGPDGFRIKMWLRSDPSLVVYDNLRGEPDTAAPPPIGGGAIRIRLG